jgi:hypothetical protein
MSGLDDLLETNETVPLKAVLLIDSKLRPGDTSSSDDDRKYVSAMMHACELFGIPPDVTMKPHADNSEVAQAYRRTKIEMDKKKIDLFHRQSVSQASVKLDATWREKIHAYIAHIRNIVQRESMDVALRDKILARLNALASDVDQYRAGVRKAADVLVGLCEAVSGGATALTPAVRVFERVVGAIERLKSKPEMLALPKPDDFGLAQSNMPQIESPAE